MLLLLLSSFLSFFPLVSNDLWWHLSTGRYIVEQGVPETDPFSFTSSQISWVNHAWLFDTLIYCIWSMTGETGLLALRILLVGILAGLIFRDRTVRGDPPWFALIWILFLLSVSRHRLMTRPELAAIVLFGILLLILKSRPTLKTILGMTIIMQLWVNIHASFLFGLAIILYYMMLQVIRSQRWTWIPAMLLPGLITLVNPYGPGAFKAPVMLMKDLLKLPVINPEWLHPPLWTFFPLYISVFILIALLFSGTQNPSEEHPAFRLLILLGTMVMALTSVRHTGFYAVAGMALLPTSSLRKRSLVVFLAILSIISLSWQMYRFYPPGGGIDHSKFPSGVVHHVKTYPPCGNLYNLPGQGGYLAWNLFPDYRVFIDGRNELYVPVLKQVNRSMSNLDTWNELLQHKNIQWAVLPYQGHVLVQKGDAQLIYPASLARFPASQWALMDYDDAAMLFYRRIDCHSKYLKQEYHFNPESPGYIMHQIQNGTWSREDVLKELQEKMRSDPSSIRASRLLKTLRGNLN